MKAYIVLFIFLLFIASSLHAKTYYVSNTGANTDGLSQANAWTYAKLNASWGIIVAGDFILFHSGETFYGQLLIQKSGSPANQITLSSYGTGAQPIISGFTPITAWINTGTNLWQGSSALPGTNKVQVVNENGLDAAIGRYPNLGNGNGGYLTITSATGTTSITDASLSGTPNWTGAKLVIRNLHPQISVNPITSQSGGTVSYTATTTYPATAKSGYYFQDDIRTLDTATEWYVDNARRVTIYAPSPPVNVMASTVDTLINALNRSYVTIIGLNIQGASVYGILAGGFGNGIKDSIINCTFNYTGKDAIHTQVSNGVYIYGCTISNSHNTGIAGTSEGGNSINMFVERNIITNSGNITGMGASGNPNYNGIYVKGNGATVINNRVINSGYSAINVYYSNYLVKNNYVDRFCYILDDGGGIYTYIGKPQTIYMNRLIDGNIILNGIGAPLGTSNGESDAMGIYLDDGSLYTDIKNNSIGNMGYAGIYLHNSSVINLYNNTVFNSGISSYYLRSNDTSYIQTDSITLVKNILASIGTTDKSHYVSSPRSDLLTMYVKIDSNYYYHSPSSTTFRYDPKTGGFDFSLVTWKSATSYDLNSTQVTTGAATFTTNPSDTVFINNFAGLRKRRMNGTFTDNADTLQAWTSSVLVDAGSVPIVPQPPVARAGADQVITLPLNHVFFDGRASTSTNGSIVVYQWAKISGTGGTILNPVADTTTVSNLTAGTYSYTLTVMDSLGLSNIDTVNVTVNSGANIPPTVVATAIPPVIELPINAASLLAVANDVDGTIVNYKWKPVAGNPAGGFIGNDAIPNPTITALQQGTYYYQITVTDNQGAIGIATVSITVLPPRPVFLTKWILAH